MRLHAWRQTHLGQPDGGHLCHVAQHNDRERQPTDRGLGKAALLQCSELPQALAELQALQGLGQQQQPAQLERPEAMKHPAECHDIHLPLLFLHWSFQSTEGNGT
jgi:hypothetical protein